MSRVNFSDLNLEKTIPTKTFSFKNKEIEILEYLPIDKKYELIIATLQQAEENGTFNPLLLEQRFNINLVFCYVNIDFGTEDESDIYDKLKQNGFFDEFFKAIDENEYNELFDYLIEYSESIMQYRGTFAYGVGKLMEVLPDQIENVSKLMKDFDTNKYESIINFAEAVNGGRPINE